MQPNTYQLCIPQLQISPKREETKSRMQKHTRIIDIMNQQYFQSEMCFSLRC